MKTLIIPCAGKSSRFPGMPPKWLLKYPDGELMVKKSIQGLPLEKFDRVVVTAVKEHVETYNAEKLLEEAFSFLPHGKYNLCVLDDFTSCQSETIYKTLKKCNISSSFAVKDSDNYIKINLDGNDNYVAGIDIQSFPREVERLTAKSFLKINDQKIITDIVEKQIVSNYVSIGMYGFDDADLFAKAYEHLKNNKSIENEIYLSHLISYLIGTQKRVYSYVEADDYEDWGTSEDWYAILNKKRTYMINVENILLKQNQYCYDGKYIFNEDNLRELKALSDEGAQIILLSSTDEKESRIIEKHIKGLGIRIHGIISNCYMSYQTLIKGFSTEIPYPACECINVKNGEKIEDYLNK